MSGRNLAKFNKSSRLHISLWAALDKDPDLYLVRDIRDLKAGISS